MFQEVPDPVWNTSIGKCSFHFPALISSAARTMAPARSFSSRPSSPLTSAA
jgi:hypothetical protein